MARIKNVDKVAIALDCESDTLDDNSCSYVIIEDKDWTVNLLFDGKGQRFTGITIAKKIYQVVSEDVIININKT